MRSTELRCADWVHVHAPRRYRGACPCCDEAITATELTGFEAASRPTGTE